MASPDELLAMLEEAAEEAENARAQEIEEEIEDEYQVCSFIISQSTQVRLQPRMF